MSASNGFWDYGGMVYKRREKELKTAKINFSLVCQYSTFFAVHSKLTVMLSSTEKCLTNPQWGESYKIFDQHYSKLLKSRSTSAMWESWEKTSGEALDNPKESLF